MRVQSITSGDSQRCGCFRSASLLVLAVGLTCFAFFACRRSVDWSRFDYDSVKGSLDVLVSGENLYHELSLQSITEAVSGTVEYLKNEPCVDSVGVSADSSVWVIFRNGLPGCVDSRLWDSTAVQGPTRSEPEVRITGTSAGQVSASCVILAPFMWQFGVHEAADYLAEKLLQCGPTMAIVELTNQAVTVEKVREYLDLGPGVLYWSTHGGLLGDNGCYLLTGEWATSESMADRLINVYNAKYEVGNRGRYLYLVPGKVDNVPGVFLGVTPAFVRRFGKFDRYGNQVPVTQSIAYISACYSDYRTATALKDSFVAAGIDAYFGWDGEVNTEFSGDKAALSFVMLSDTFTTGEAIKALGNRTSPKGGALNLTGDSFVMIRSYVAATSGAVRKVDRYPSATVSSSGTGIAAPACGLTLMFPGAQAGVFDVNRDPGTMLIYVDGVRGYTAMYGYQGVSGSISVGGYGRGVISGVFSGTLGWWDFTRTPPPNPMTDPPDATMVLSDGVIKTSGIAGSTE